MPDYVNKQESTLLHDRTETRDVHLEFLQLPLLWTVARLLPGVVFANADFADVVPIVIIPHGNSTLFIFTVK